MTPFSQKPPAFGQRRPVDRVSHPERFRTELHYSIGRRSANRRSGRLVVARMGTCAGPPRILQSAESRARGNGNAMLHSAILRNWEPAYYTFSLLLSSHRRGRRASQPRRWDGDGKGVVCRDGVGRRTGVAEALPAAGASLSTSEGDPKRRLGMSRCPAGSSGGPAPWPSPPYSRLPSGPPSPAPA